MQRITFPLCLAALGWPAAPLLAQNADPEILVTGRALPDPAGSQAAGEVVIDPDTEGQPAQRLEQLLSGIAGFQPFRRADTRSSHPTANGLVLRGLGGNAASRARVLLDGVPISDPFGGWISWVAVNPASLSQIKIIRGGDLLASGPGALSGVISLRSKGSEPTASGEISYGSRDSLSLGSVLAGGLGNGAAMAAVRYDRGDGFIPTNESQRGPVDRRSPYESGSVRLRGIMPLGGGELQANAGGFHDRRERGTAFSDNDQTGGDASLRYVRDGNWDIEALAYVRARAFDTGFARVQDTAAGPRSLVTEALDQSTSASAIGGKVELRPPSQGPISLRLGADFERVEGVTRERASFAAGTPRIAREAGGNNSNLGLYAEADWQASDTFLLTGGVRADHMKRREGRLVERDLGGGSPIAPVFAADRNDFHVSARLGARLDLGNGLAARAAAYRTYRQPTLNELYRPYRVGADGVAANPGLDEERLTGGEAGIDWQSADDRTTIAMTAYYAHLENAISNVTLATSPGGGIACAGVGIVFGTCQQRRNVDAVRSKGIEFDATHRSRTLDARLSLALTDAEVEGSGISAALDGKRPPQVPEAAAVLSLGWRPIDRVELRARVEWQAERFEDDLETQTLNDFTRIDLGARYTLSDDWSVGVSAENVFDTRIETGVSGDGIIERSDPRTIWFSLSFGR